MPSIPHVLALEYLGRRVQQLRADPIRRNSRFFPWGDHLLDDLNILEIPTPDYVHVSRDCKRVEYTWTADSDPRNSHNLAEKIAMNVERAARNPQLLDRLDIWHIGILRSHHGVDRPLGSQITEAGSPSTEGYKKRVHSPSPGPFPQQKRSRVSKRDADRGSVAQPPPSDCIPGSHTPLARRTVQEAADTSGNATLASQQHLSLLSRISMNDTKTASSEPTDANHNGALRPSVRSSPKSSRLRPVSDGLPLAADVATGKRPDTPPRQSTSEGPYYISTPASVVDGTTTTISAREVTAGAAIVGHMARKETVNTLSEDDLGTTLGTGTGSATMSCNKSQENIRFQDPTSTSTTPSAPVTSNGEVSVANASAPGLLLIPTALAPTAQAALPAKSKELVPEALSSSMQAENTPVPVDGSNTVLVDVITERPSPTIASDGNMPKGSSLAQPTAVVQPAPDDQTADVARQSAAMLDRLMAREAEMETILGIMYAAVMHALSLANLDELTELISERAARQ